VHNSADQLTQITQRDTWLGGELNQWYNRDYGYDNNGCLTQENVTRPEWNTNSAIAEYTVDYTWDYDAHLTSVSSVVQYLYDASGVRIGRIHNSVTNYFVVDYADPLKRPLAETDASGAVTRYYVWAGFRLLAHIEANGTVRYYHSDELGSTLALTDENGEVTDQFAYTPYGRATHIGSTDTPYQWLGGYGVYYDIDTQLHLTLHRAYSCSLKRFISTDPLGIDGGVNLYAYGNLNPLAFVDPYGLCADSGSSGSWFNSLYNEVLSWPAQHQQSEKNYAQNTAAYYNSRDYQQYSTTWAHAVKVGIDDVNEAIGTKLAVAAMVYSFATMPAATPTPTTTALSPFRLTTEGESFIRYESANPAYTRVTSSGGVQPGTFAAPASDGIIPLADRISVYNLPSADIHRPNITTLNPPAGTLIVGPRPVSGGTGNEVIFPMGY